MHCLKVPGNNIFTISTPCGSLDARKQSDVDINTTECTDEENTVEQRTSSDNYLRHQVQIFHYHRFNSVSVEYHCPGWTERRVVSTQAARGSSWLPGPSRGGLFLTCIESLWLEVTTVGVWLSCMRLCHCTSYQRYLGPWLKNASGVCSVDSGNGWASGGSSCDRSQLRSPYIPRRVVCVLELLYATRICMKLI